MTRLFDKMLPGCSLAERAEKHPVLGGMRNLEMKVNPKDRIVDVNSVYKFRDILKISASEEIL